MTKPLKPALKILHYSKYLGLALIIIGVPIIIFAESPGSEMPLLVGLFTLFVTTDKFDDERSVQIKTASLYFAFVISYTIKLITTNLHDHALIAFELLEINHYLILTLALANLIFYGRMYVIKH